MTKQERIVTFEQLRDLKHPYKLPVPRHLRDRGDIYEMQEGYENIFDRNIHVVYELVVAYPEPDFDW